jgi:acyl-CoA synthetase (AMP-forming)/AMP-acid ligase II
MILETRTTRDTFRPGAVYEAYAGEADKTVAEATAIWDFLSAAAGAPMTLRLHAEAAPGRRWIGDPGHLDPLLERCHESVLTLFTSGTTGRPKPATHRLTELLAKKRGGSPNDRWLLAYAPYRWAGMSVLLHALRFGSVVVVPRSLEPADVVRAGIDDEVTHVSMTPSYLRRLQLSVAPEDLARLPLRQLTFGGEAATQSVLDAARALWPQARISHVYASTEFGDICSASDGLAGFPAGKLERPEFGRTDDGELIIRSQLTGDLWERRGDRYVFLGRRQEVINVGGAKVFPAVVEAAALELDGVEEARAFAISNALLGQVVGLDYRGSRAETEVKRLMREKLPKVAWPAQVQRVESIALTSAAKVKRIGEG